MNRLLVANHDSVDWRILPHAHTFEAQLACVKGGRGGNVHGEEHRCNVTEHIASLPRSPAQSLVSLSSVAGPLQCVPEATSHAHRTT